MTTLDDQSDSNTGSSSQKLSLSQQECDSGSESKNEESFEDDPNDEDFTLDKSSTLKNLAGTETAKCEFCGKRSTRDSFYSSTKRFCSEQCCQKARGRRKFRVSKSSHSAVAKEKRKESVSPPRTTKVVTKRDLSETFDWLVYLKLEEFKAAPVHLFNHAPLSETWGNISLGLMVEVENTDCDNDSPVSYWAASVNKLAGYKARLRYEGFDDDSSLDFWVNLCSKDLHPIGWCAKTGKSLVPPKAIINKYLNWKDFLIKRLTGSRTLPVDFHEKVQESLESMFRPGMLMEVVDKNRINTTRVAEVTDVVGGRLLVKYVGADPDDHGFWCHERSPLIHPVGWSQVIGHTLLATSDYAQKSLQKAMSRKFDRNDATWDLFWPVGTCNSDRKFKEGMKLEAIDPLNLSTICVATVTKVMRNNYLMIGLDGYITAKGLDCFCYHASSPCIFPTGFCERNKIKLTPPKGQKGEFKWKDYLLSTKSEPAPEELFNMDTTPHGFEVGMRVEAVDVLDPRFICVGTIVRVVRRLIRVHFDGWDENYDQWCDCETPDLYPLGWCDTVQYPLEAPKNFVDISKRRPKRACVQRYEEFKKLTLEDATDWSDDN